MKQVTSETSVATRRMLSAILTQLSLLLAALALGGLLVGWLVAGMAGVWGALLGVGIAAFFLVTTVVAARATADQPVHVTSAALVGAWIVKVIVLFVVLAIVRGRDFYTPGVLFVVVALAVIGSTVIEMREVARARVPTTGPTGGQ